MIDRAMNAAGAGEDKTKHTMKVLEEYAIECSISKVYGSEALDLRGRRSRADLRRLRLSRRLSRRPRLSRFARQPHLRGHQRNQPHADHSDADEARAFRRVAAAGRGRETAGRNSRAARRWKNRPTAQWAEEERIVAGAKKAFLLAAGAAMQKYREKLADQQEIVAALADIVIEIYVMESALLRAREGRFVRAARTLASADDRGGARSAPRWRRPHRNQRPHRAGRLGSKATCCAPNSPSCAASSSANPSIPLRFAASSPTPLKPQIAIPSRAAKPVPLLPGRSAP